MLNNHKHWSYHHSLMILVFFNSSNSCKTKKIIINTLNRMNDRISGWKKSLDQSFHKLSCFLCLSQHSRSRKIRTRFSQVSRFKSLQMSRFCWKKLFQPEIRICHKGAGIMDPSFSMEVRIEVSPNNNIIRCMKMAKAI